MTKFTDLDLDPKVLQAIAEAGYESPTPIQEKAIPHALMAKDVLGIAQTGTGKTAAFTLPMISIFEMRTLVPAEDPNATPEDDAVNDGGKV